jgi:hypothetical protein
MTHNPRSSRFASGAPKWRQTLCGAGPATEEFRRRTPHLLQRRSAPCSLRTKTRPWPVCWSGPPNLLCGTLYSGQLRGLSPKGLRQSGHHILPDARRGAAAGRLRDRPRPESSDGCQLPVASSQWGPAKQNLNYLGRRTVVVGTSQAKSQLSGTQDSGKRQNRRPDGNVHGVLRG